VDFAFGLRIFFIFFLKGGSDEKKKKDKTIIKRFVKHKRKKLGTKRCEDQTKTKKMRAEQ